MVGTTRDKIETSNCGNPLQSSTYDVSGAEEPNPWPRDVRNMSEAPDVRNMNEAPSFSNQWGRKARDVVAAPWQNCKP